MLIFALTAGLGWAQATVDLRPDLPEGRHLLWTHSVVCEQESHWGSSTLRALVLTHQHVERGGRPGHGLMEWTDVVEDVGVELELGGRLVTTWQVGEERGVATQLRRFEILQDTSWSSHLKASGELEVFQLRSETSPAWPSQATGPLPPELLAWLEGLALGGPLGETWQPWAVGEERTYSVELPIWGVDTVTMDLSLTLAGAGPSVAELRYTAVPAQEIDPDRSLRVLEVAAAGTAIFDHRRHRLVEHHSTVQSVLRQGVSPVVRTERIDSYLHRVRRRLPRKGREAEL